MATGPQFSYANLSLVCSYPRQNHTHPGATNTQTLWRIYGGDEEDAGDDEEDEFKE